MTSLSSPRSRTPGRRGLAVALVGACLLLTACAGQPGDDAASATAEAVEGGTLRIDGPGDSGSNPCLDPFQSWGSDWTLLSSNIAERLVDQDPETGEIVPWLATAWTVSDDGLTYTFTLHDGVTFADGAAFDAAAVKTAYDTDLAVVEENPGILGAEDIAGLAEVVAIDESTVALTLQTPDSSFLSRLSSNRLGILSPDSYLLSTEDRCRVGISSTAAFQVTAFTPYESVEFTRRDDYTPTSALSTHDGGAYLDTVQYTFVSEDNVRVGNLTSGASDAAWKINPYFTSDRAQLEAAGIRVEQRSVPGTAYIYWGNNAEGHPLAERDVRLAVQHAIDRASYASVLYGDDYPAATGPYDAGTALTEEGDADLLAHDTELAGSLLDDAGWQLGDDGYRTRDGERLTLVALSYGSNDVGEELLQAQLKEVGIDLQLAVGTAAEISARQSEGDFDLAYGYSRGNDPTSLFRFYNEQGSGGLRGVDDATAAKIIDLVDANTLTTDADERLALSTEFQNALLEEGLVFPIFDRMQQVALSDAVGGLEFTAESVIRFRDLWLAA